MQPALRALTLISALGFSLSAFAQTGSWAALYEEIKPYRETLQSASVLYNSDKWYAQSYTVPDRPESMRKFLADLGTIEKMMSGTYANVVAPKSYLDREIMEHPEAWLEIARARGTIAESVVRRSLGTKATTEVAFINNITSTIKTHDGWGLTETGLKILMGKRTEVRNSITGGMDQILTAAGITPQGELLPGWDAACDKMAAEAIRLAPLNKVTAKYADSYITGLIKSGWAKNYKDRTILKVATGKADWTIVKNSLGVPKYRSKGVAVQYRVPSFKYVIEQSISILQDYSGGGKYTYRPTAQLSDYRILLPK